MSGRQRISTLELFCFGMATIITVGWSYALIVAWDLNADDLPQTLAIIAVLIGFGLYRRKRRLASSRRGASF